jgi:hypothetical protein
MVRPTNHAQNACSFGEIDRMICFLLNFFSGYVFLFVPLDEVGKILRH